MIRLLVVSASLLLLGSPLAAAVELELHVGLDGQRIHGPWTHLRVIVVDPAEPIQGELQLFLGEPDETRPEYVVPVQAMPGSRQSYSLALPSNLAEATDPSLFDGIIVEFGAKDKSLPVTLRLTAAGTILAEKSTVIEDFLLPEDQVLVVGQQGGGYDFLRTHGQQAVVYARASALPMDWAAYRGLNAVIAADSDLRQLNQEQKDALTMWLRSGGRLVVTGANLRQNVAAPLLQELLPMTTGPAVERDAQNITGVLREFLDIAPGDQIRVVPLEAASGRVLAEIDGQPLVVGQAVGSGSLHILAFDPTRHSVERWPAKANLFQRLWQDSVKNLYADDIVLDRLARAMLHSIPASPVGRAEVFLALSLLILLVSGAFAIGLRFGLPVMMVLVAAAVLAHGAIAYQWLGRNLETSQTKLLETAIIRKHPLETQAFVDSYLLYHSHSELTGSLRMPRRVGGLAPLTADAESLLRHHVSLRPEGSFWTAAVSGTELPLSQALRTQYLRELPIYLAADWEEQWVTISNQSPYRMEKMYLYTENGYYALFSLNPFTERTIQVSSRHGQSHPPWMYRQQLWEPIRWQEYLESGIFVALRDKALQEWEAKRFLVASLQGPPSPVYQGFAGEDLFQGFLIIPVM